MASAVLFIVMAIIACILLLVVSLTATAGAIDTFNSVYYTSDPNIRSAHQYLTISAALGWSSLAILIVILVVAAIAGGFSTVEISEALLTKTNPTKEDLIAAYRGERELAAGYTTQIIVLITLIILAIVIFIIGSLSAVAASSIANMKQRDSYANSAYTYSIVTAVIAILGIGIMITAIIAYWGIKIARDTQLKEVEVFDKKIQQQYGVTPAQLIQTQP